LNIAASVTITAYTEKLMQYINILSLFPLAMQALVIVLASLIVAFAALSLASNYELFAQQQQTCKDSKTGEYLTSFSCGNARVLENGTTVRNYTLLASDPDNHE
jgi:hypothetical protein